MLAVWIYAEITLWFADKTVRREAAQGRARQMRILPETKRRLRERLERVWAEAAADRQEDGMESSVYTSYSGGSEWSGSEGGGASSRRTALYSRDPRKRFTSVQWYRRVSQWKTLHSTKSRLFKTTVLARSWFDLLSLFHI